jgi:hypothetical protein
MASLETELIVATFLDSGIAKALPHRRDDVRRFALLLVASAIDDLGIEPRLLDGEQAREALQLTARKLGRGDPLAAAGGSIVKAFFGFLAATEVVPHSYELSLATDEASERFAAMAAAVEDEQRIGGALPTIRNRAAGVGRNEKCPCGSGRKFKQCCGRQGLA